MKEADNETLYLFVCFSQRKSWEKLGSTNESYSFFFSSASNTPLRSLNFEYKDEKVVNSASVQRGQKEVAGERSKQQERRRIGFRGR